MGFGGGSIQYFDVSFGGRPKVDGAIASITLYVGAPMLRREQSHPRMCRNISVLLGRILPKDSVQDFASASTIVWVSARHIFLLNFLSAVTFGCPEFREQQEVQHKI